MVFKSNRLIELLENKEVILFGAGVMAKYYKELYDIDVKYYVDNNPQKWNTEYLSRRIISPQELNNYKDNSVILICSQYVQEISAQLEELGLVKNKNYFIPRDLEEEHIIDSAGIYEDNCNKKRILLDMSQLAWTDNAPGISRVVKNLIEAAYCNEKYYVVAVQQVRGHLYEPTQWLRENNLLNDESNEMWRKIIYKDEDILLLPDAIWGQYDSFKKISDEIHKINGKVYNIIHDIIPIENPDRCDRFLVNTFKHMFEDLLQRNDGIITISKTVAEKVINYIDNNHIYLKNDFKIGWFHNGFDKKIFKNVDINSNTIKEIMNRKPFIIVGTIEPRKGHTIALDAFETLWNEGYDKCLCIIGKVGWNVKELLQRIKNHKEYNKKLFFIEYPSDEELAYCYKNSEALIFPSINEGFGLPLIEGASYKLPLILSDIDIFKELAEDNAVYFKCGNSESLVQAICEYEKLKELNRLPNSQNIHINTWEESFERIMDVIFNSKWYREYK